jgi:hypothetical protein
MEPQSKDCKHVFENLTAMAKCLMDGYAQLDKRLAELERRVEIDWDNFKVGGTD